MSRAKKPAYAYLRTSSHTNVGDDKDSDKRQRAAIEAFARSAGYRVVESFYDAAVSGADPVNERPGFTAMLAAVAGDGVRTILIESPDRFARDLMVQLAGHDRLRGLGVELVPTSAPDHFREDTPTARMVRQILGAVAEFEKAGIVAKLKAARDRKRAETGRCEVRPGHSDLRPDAVALARRLRRVSPKTGKRRSLRAIAAALAEAGHVSASGNRFGPSAIKAMVD